jgi:hypothetical protein
LTASDAGKLALYLHFIIDELKVPQTFATLLYEGHQGALPMAHAGKQPKHYLSH